MAKQRAAGIGIVVAILAILGGVLIYGNRNWTADDSAPWLRAGGGPGNAAGHSDVREGASGVVLEASVEELVRALRTGDLWVRHHATESLGEMATDSSDVVAALIAALQDDHEMIRGEAARTLARRGADRHSGETIPALVPALRDPDAWVRCQVAVALGHMGQAAVSPLVDALGDLREPVRSSAALALGRIGPDARPAIGSLIDALSDPEPTVRRNAVRALWQIDIRDERVIRVLQRVRDDEDEWVRRMAEAALTSGTPTSQPQG